MPASVEGDRELKVEAGSMALYSYLRLRVYLQWSVVKVTIADGVMLPLAVWFVLTFIASQSWFDIDLYSQSCDL